MSNGMLCVRFVEIDQIGPLLIVSVNDAYEQLVEVHKELLKLEKRFLTVDHLAAASIAERADDVADWILCHHGYTGFIKEKKNAKATNA